MNERENAASISAVLRAVPAELEPTWDGEVIRIAQGGESWAFRPVWVGEGLPADARRARDEIVHRDRGHSPVIPVVTARRITPGAKEILESERLSWADVSGRAHLVVPGRLYITRLEPIRADAGRAFKWSAAADAIAETLLATRVRERGSRDLSIDRVIAVAETAGVSSAHAARVLRHFDEQGYTVKTGAERGSSATREFRDPGRMLSDWAGHYRSTARQAPVAEFHVPWAGSRQSTEAVHRALWERDWALTGEAAAERIAPYLTSIPSLDVYVPEAEIPSARERLSRQPDVTEVESGGRIRLHAAQPYVFRLSQEVMDARTASPVRVYADLLRGTGRSAEAGEYLREVAIGF